VDNCKGWEEVDGQKRQNNWVVRGRQMKVTPKITWKDYVKKDMELWA
jgi:hypothetical protein